MLEGKLWQSGTSRPAVVLDRGSNTTKAGFGGQTEPSVVMPSVVGRPRGERLDEGSATTTTTTTRFGKTVYVGDDAQSKRGILLMKRFIECGVVTNFDELEAVWGHLFDEKLRVNISATPLLVAEGESMNPKCNREKLTQIAAFETFSVPQFFLAPSPALILAAAGRAVGGSGAFYNTLISLCSVCVCVCVCVCVLRARNVSQYIMCVSVRTCVCAHTRPRVCECRERERRSHE